MSGLLFMSTSDFFTAPTNNGNLLCHKIQGFTLILFYSTDCVYCKELIPIFKKLPGTVGGCQFGMINVSTNEDVVELAKHTITPIDYVPLILLFYNGKPVMIYKGPKKAEVIQSFVIDVASKMQQKQKFYTKPKEQPERETQQRPLGATPQPIEKTSRIPAYTIGVPKCDDNVCYLTEKTAYA